MGRRNENRPVEPDDPDRPRSHTPPGMGESYIRPIPHPQDMDPGYVHASLEDFATAPEKPATRWEVSPQLGMGGYNFNVAELETGQRLAQNAFHAHANQEEFFFVIEGRCRVETATDSFDCGPDEMVLFRRGAVHLLHNPYTDPCRLIAIGHPAAGRRPVEPVEDFDALIAERYPDGNAAEGTADVD